MPVRVQDMKRVILRFTTLLLLLPIFHQVALAEESEPAANPKELAAGLERCWNWLESLSDFQPYLPAEMPPPNRMVHLDLMTARKCKSRGVRLFDSDASSVIAAAQAKVGDKTGLLASFREFNMAPKDQGRYLVELAFTTGNSDFLAEFGDESHSYRIELAYRYADAGQLDKAFEILSADYPAKNADALYRCRASVAVSYAEAGQLEKAIEILAAIPKDKKRLAAFQEGAVAGHLADAGKIGDARRLSASYLTHMGGLETPESRLREAYWGAAPLLQKIGDAKERRSFLEDCERWTEEARRPNASAVSRSSEAHSLVNIAIRLGDKESARKWANRAVQCLKEGAKRDEFRLAQFASLQASLDLVEESKQTAKEAIAAARDHSDLGDRDYGFSSVAGSLASYRNEILAGEIDTAIGEIQGLTWRAFALRGALEIAIGHEQWNLAKRYLAEGREYLNRKDHDRTEVFVHRFEFDLLAARLHAKSGDQAAARGMLRELFKRGYSRQAGDFTEKVFKEQERLGFFDDAWRTAIWIPELDIRFRALGSLTGDAIEADAMKNMNKNPKPDTKPQNP